MSSVVVVDDISPMVGTVYVDRIWYCGSGVVGVSKTHYSVLPPCCVGYIDRESQGIRSIIIVFPYEDDRCRRF